MEHVRIILPELDVPGAILPCSAICDDSRGPGQVTEVQRIFLPGKLRVTV